MHANDCYLGDDQQCGAGSTPQLGHAIGSTSNTRLRHAAHALEDALSASLMTPSTACCAEDNAASAAVGGDQLAP